MGLLKAIQQHKLNRCFDKCQRVYEHLQNINSPLAAEMVKQTWSTQVSKCIERFNSYNYLTANDMTMINAVWKELNKNYPNL